MNNYISQSGRFFWGKVCHRPRCRGGDVPLDRQLPRGHAELPAAKSGGAGGTGRRLGGILVGWLVNKQWLVMRGYEGFLKWRGYVKPMVLPMMKYLSIVWFWMIGSPYDLGKPLFCWFQWIGFLENWNRKTPYFTGKMYGFQFGFSCRNQSIDCW